MHEQNATIVHGRRLQPAACLPLTLFLGALCAGAAHGGGTITNGLTHQGTIAVAGGSDSWTFAPTNGNSLLGGLKLCEPLISGTNVLLGGAGAPANGSVVLYSTTNVANPTAPWTPVSTNQTDQFGVLAMTNLFDRSPPRRFFRLGAP